MFTGALSRRRAARFPGSICGTALPGGRAPASSSSGLQRVVLVFGGSGPRPGTGRRSSCPASSPAGRPGCSSFSETSALLATSCCCQPLAALAFDAVRCRAGAPARRRPAPGARRRPRGGCARSRRGASGRWRRSASLFTVGPTTCTSMGALMPKFRTWLVMSGARKKTCRPVQVDGSRALTQLLHVIQPSGGKKILELDHHLAVAEEIIDGVARWGGDAADRQADVVDDRLELVLGNERPGAMASAPRRTPARSPRCASPGPPERGSGICPASTDGKKVAAEGSGRAGEMDRADEGDEAQGDQLAVIERPGRGSRRRRARIRSKWTSKRSCRRQMMSCF